MTNMSGKKESILLQNMDNKNKEILLSDEKHSYYLTRLINHH